MYRWIVSVAACLMLCACGADSDPQEPDPGEQEETVDYCEVFGWYGDGNCDDVCPLPDPDCEATPPDPEPDPPETPACEPEQVGWARDYMAEQPCSPSEFECDDWVSFADACGCGCEEPQNTEPEPDPAPMDVACLDDSKPDVERYGDEAECQDIDFDCPESWSAFDDDCGCGCILNCSDDFECPDGYCDLDLFVPHCTYPDCGDGTELACRMSKPDCYDSDVATVINGCWECRDARTCGPSMGP